MNSRQRRKQEAAEHNKLRAEQKALELDRKENPEKYRRKRPSRKVLSNLAIWSAFAASATILNEDRT